MTGLAQGLRIAVGAPAPRQLLLLLDFDGTLAPLAPRPEEAALRPAMRDALERFGRRADVSVGVISGRSLPDVRERVGISSFYFGGNHGLDMSGPAFAYRHPRAERVRGVVAAAAARARGAFRDVPGAIVEDKGLSLALHFRAVRRADRPRAGLRLRQVKAALRGLPLRWRRGSACWEVLPRLGWDKGCAAALLHRRLNRPTPVVVGDDATDEDMFAAFPDGVTVHVGRSRKTRARYALPSQAAVLPFLQDIEAVLEAR